MAVVIETTLGDLTVDLFTDQRPLTCLNFLKLCKLKFYNFNLFHTIQHGFIAQTGDPTGEGLGGQSVWGIVEGPDKRYFEGEKMPRIKHSQPGLLSMVATTEGMIGSQFFFTLASDLNSLDGQHCIIGEVTEGHEVLRLMNETICDSSHRPYQDVRITHTVVLEDPFNDPTGLQVPSRSPSPSAERLAGGRIAPDEELDDTKGKTEQEIAEMIQEKEAKARATILEIVGDLPDADMAPPENVLFVCKLNPVTTDDDLEIIFSRFGKIVCCEVIRDKKTGDSLQYAFIEFDNKKSCEDAFFKMDNVLIDDRRIHVDFSQSVSKIKWQGKGRGVIVTGDGNFSSNDHNKSRKFTPNDNKLRDSKELRPKTHDRYNSRENVAGRNTYENSRSFREDNSRNSNNYNSDHRKLDDRNRSREKNLPTKNSYKNSDSRRISPDRRKERERTPDRSRERRSPDKARDRPRSSERSRERQRSLDKYRERKRSPVNSRRRDRTPERSRKTPDKYRKANRSPENLKDREHKNQEMLESKSRYDSVDIQKTSNKNENSSKSSSFQGNSTNMQSEKNNRNEHSSKQTNDSKNNSIKDRAKNSIETDKCISEPTKSHLDNAQKDPQSSKKMKKKVANNKRKSSSVSSDEDSDVDEPPKKKNKKSEKVEKKGKNKKTLKKKKTKQSSDTSEDSEEAPKKSKSNKTGKSKKNERKKKKIQSSSSSDSSSSDSSDSSDTSDSSSDSDDGKKKKKKSKRSKVTKKKRSKKQSSSSSSSDSSSTSSDESSSTSDSSDSGHERSRKKSKNKKSVREKLAKKKSKK